MTENQPIIVAAVVIRDAQSRVLTVRKRATELFMLPGGKLEEGEDSLAAAIREVREEVGLELDPRQLTVAGIFSAPAANEPGRTVRASVFSAPDAVEPHSIAPAAEIAEVAWVDPGCPADSRSVALAPLLSDALFPHLQ